MKNNITVVSASVLMQMLHKQEDIQLLDVRERWEHDAFNIGGANIPLQTIFENIDLISKDKTVVVYCQKGIRSQIAIQRLQQRYDFNNLVNLTGGMDAWRRAEKINSSEINNVLE